MVYLIKPQNCTLPGAQEFTKFGKHAFGSTRIRDLKHKGAFKIDWETVITMVLPPAPDEGGASRIFQFENGVRYCTKRFIGAGCGIDRGTRLCRNDHMYQSNALLVASTAAMQAVANVVDTEMPSRELIQIFADAQCVAMGRPTIGLPADSIIQSIGRAMRTTQS